MFSPCSAVTGLWRVRATVRYGTARRRNVRPSAPGTARGMAQGAACFGPILRPLAPALASGAPRHAPIRHASASECLSACLFLIAFHRASLSVHDVMAAACVEGVRHGHVLQAILCHPLFAEDVFVLDPSDHIEFSCAGLELLHGWWVPYHWASDLVSVHGVLSCFDRMLFRGYLPIMSGASMAQFLQSEQVNCGNLKDFLLTTAQRLKCHAESMAAAAGRPYVYVTSADVRMEREARGAAGTKRDHGGTGVRVLVHVHVQTWFPLRMQVFVNGHDWLARKLEGFLLSKPLEPASFLDWLRSHSG